MRRQQVKLKATTGANKGQVLYFDTDGYAPATQAIVDADLTKAWKPVAVVDKDVAAPTAGQATAAVAVEGIVEVLKLSGALTKGQKVGITTTAGQVGALAKPDAPATYAEATAQAEFNKLFYYVGVVHEDAASGASTVKIRLGTS